MMRMMKKRRVPDRKSVGIKWMAFIILLDGAHKKSLLHGIMIIDTFD